MTNKPEKLHALTVKAAANERKRGKLPLSPSKLRANAARVCPRLNMSKKLSTKKNRTTHVRYRRTHTNTCAHTQAYLPTSGRATDVEQKRVIPQSCLGLWERRVRSVV